MCLTNRGANICKYLQHETDHQVKHDEYRQDPKTDEIQPRPCRIHHHAEHVTSHVPVVHHHDMKQRDQTRTKIIEVHQIVQPGRKIIISLCTVRCQFSPIQKLSQYSKYEEYGIKGAEHSKRRRLELLICHHNNLELFQLPQHVQQSKHAEQTNQIEVLHRSNRLPVPVISCLKKVDHRNE